MVDFSDEAIIARVSDKYIGAASFSAMFTNVATLRISLDTPQNFTGEIFRITGHNYHFSMWIEKGNVFLARNNHVAKRPICHPQLHTTILVSMSPDKFQLAVYDSENIGDDCVCITVSTPELIFVPNSLIRWSKKTKRIDQRKFENYGQVMSSIYESFHQTHEQIRDNNMYKLFWESIKDENGDKKFTPKNEPVVFQGVLGLMQEHSLLKDYTIVSEPNAGSGNLDALIIASLANGDQVKVAIEAKNAYSNDLIHGLQHQLPEYMRAKDADFGIYLVLWYKCKLFNKPKQDKMDSDLALRKLITQKNIEVHYLDLALPITPSNANFEFS